jgi:hypothetical protein
MCLLLLVNYIRIAIKRKWQSGEKQRITQVIDFANKVLSESLHLDAEVALKY